MTYTAQQLDAMADRHDAYSACTEPASENFAPVCREYAAVLRVVAAFRESYPAGERTVFPTAPPVVELLDAIEDASGGAS